MMSSWVVGFDSSVRYSNHNISEGREYSTMWVGGRLYFWGLGSF